MLLGIKISQMFLLNSSLTLTADSCCHISLPAAFTQYELYKEIYSSLRQSQRPKLPFSFSTAVQFLTVIKDKAAKNN